MAINLVSGPIPGQSLTAEPGSRPWEQPPQFNDEDEVMEYMLPRLLNPKNALRMADLMKQGVPATAITDSLLMAGFAEGKWSPDLAFLVALPIFETVKKAVELAGGKVVEGTEDKYTYKPDETLMKLAEEDAYAAEAEDEKNVSEPLEEEPAPKFSGEGIMGEMNG